MDSFVWSMGHHRGECHCASCMFKITSISHLTAEHPRHFRPLINSRTDLWYIIDDPLGGVTGVPARKQRMEIMATSFVATRLSGTGQKSRAVPTVDTMKRPKLLSMSCSMHMHAPSPCDAYAYQ